MDDFAKLNPQQREAVTAGSGPVLVLAGPGSGKTRVLTHRIAYLIGSLGVRPFNILAVTFTNKAAREMGNRVADLVGENTRGLTLGTFHATCAKILRREAEHLPIQSSFVIFDQDYQINLVKQAIAELNLDDKKYRPIDVHAKISSAKNKLKFPHQFTTEDHPDKAIQRIYQRYQEMLLVNNALDFDDLLLWTAYLLEEKPVVRDRYSRKYEHILVDEFQDTNMAQYQLLRNLASFHRNIFVVGDADQSIYRWRGADYRNEQRFRKEFPEAQVILLEQNYRSRQSILDLATCVIDRNPQRTPKRLHSDLGAGQKPILFEANDDRLEATFVVDMIRKLILEKQAASGDFAVMYRTNAQSRLLEEAFLNTGIKYKLVGAQRFYGRKEIKDIIGYIRLIHNPDDELSLTRVINAPTRGIGNKTYLHLKTLAQRENLQPGRLLLQLAQGAYGDALDTIGKRARQALLNFGAQYANWVVLKDQISPMALMDIILFDTHYQSFLDDGTDKEYDRWENVLELRRLASDYQEQGLEAFLERVALVSDQDTLAADANAPTLLTLHAAKGLEFPFVFITGLNDGLLPHSRSFEDPEAMHEERRLFYVGITRAKEVLFLTYAQYRYVNEDYSERMTPSRYLDEIPYDLIDEIHPTAPQRRSSTEAQTRPDQWETTRKQAVSAGKAKEKPPIQQKFAPSMRVEHPVWGEGMVLNSRIQDDDEIVDVFFANLGLKHLSASLARLEIKS